MSADPKSQQTQPPISQLWPGFGANTSDVSNLNNTSTVAKDANGIAGKNQANNNSNNNNRDYVNFNQFIMQHNLLVGGGGTTAAGGGLSSDITGPGLGISPSTYSNNAGGLFPNPLMGQYQAQDHHEYRSAIGNKLPQQQPQYSYFNPQSTPFMSFNNFQMDAGPKSNNNNLMMGDNLQNYNVHPFSSNSSSTGGMTANNLYDNKSGSSYGLNFNGSSGLDTANGGTTYYANPFATGFDFSNTKLQATAPEFVPRFDKLSLNETNQTNLETNGNNVGGEKHGRPTTADLTQTTSNGRAGDHKETAPSTADTSFEKEEKRHQHRRNNRHNNTKQDKENNRRNHNRIERNMERFSRNLQEKNTNNDSASNSNSSTPSLIMNGGGGGGGGGGGNGSSTSASGNNHQQQVDGNGGGVQKNTGAFSKSSQNQRNGDRFRNGNSEQHPEMHDKNDKHNYQGQNKRYQNGRRSQEYSAPAPGEREERFDRYERNDRSERGGRNQRNDHHQRYDNYRSNKRRDDWNRHRDRINGYRVDEKYSHDNGKDSPLPSPEKKSPKKVFPENEKLSQREKLIRDIECRRLECLVCVESIKAHQSVWSCHNCYHILHLQCIIKWASSSKSDDGWRCPACQNVEKDVPRDYYCFCGKVKNPPNNRQDIAHSCGEVCGRVEGCPHACTLLCHPGPCPPCQAQVKRECGCGKTSKTMQCCIKETIECDSTCEKLLNCELHVCQEKCHEGKCPPCKEKVDQKCHCSKNERQVTCTRESHLKHVYSCGKPCGKDLSCGNHKCNQCCHGGECKPCKMSPDLVTSCPCGKMPIVAEQRKSCLDPIPLCEGVCGKTLKCGKATNPHHCTFKCHAGNCPPCNKQTAVKCRCGHMDQMIKCRQLSTRADDARCKKLCTKKRSCGKHKCKQECCIDIDHFCPLPCRFTLSCGKHKCDLPCHRGNCPPCYRSSFEELFCECGAEVIYPPVPCGTKKPICKKPCSRQHPCDHPPQHNCHSAATCPPCMMFTTQWCYGQHEQRKTIPCSQKSFSCGLACNKPLPCGRHKCIKTCHEGPCQTPGEICKQSCTTARPNCGHKCMAPCHDGDCPETPCKEMVEVQCECGNRKQMRTCAELVREFSRIATAQLASSMAEMQRGNYMELSEILAPVKLTNKSNKTLDCSDDCRTLERNRRLAIGLQIRNPDLPQKLLTKYSDFIRNFAKRDPALVKSIHEALTTLVKLAKESKQKSRSHSFPTMNREKRQLVHEMCEMFGVESVAYDAEPNRNVVATAFKDRSWLPATSIMEVMARESGQRRVPVPSNNAWGLKR
ncbi:protein shuttle craft isoform X1 [Musca domestica]|uniref:Protein shuttle craft isoform X1 n=1 Tax=Musca domestica TaxID=7370 RepID=A0A1I8N6G0_MUSDO|nr:protein shuttle craft isoform X1 [Musca domestica]XP_058986250.1 protein shuttle craft isoform X1 [Musca domestica]